MEELWTSQSNLAQPSSWGNPNLLKYRDVWCVACVEEYMADWYKSCNEWTEEWSLFLSNLRLDIFLKIRIMICREGVDKLPGCG